MAMRVRLVQSKIIAVCAARSIEKENDFYIDDNWHYCLAQEFDSRHPEYFGNDPSYDIEAVAWLHRQSPLASEVAAAIEVKLTKDRNEVWGYQHWIDPHILALIELEESNNPNRTWWDGFYGVDAAK